jgi:hypothetical protein
LKKDDSITKIIKGLKQKINLDRITKEEYNENKKNIKRNALLRFNDYSLDLKARTDNIIFDSFKPFGLLCMFIVVFFIFSNVLKFLNIEFIKNKPIQSIIIFVLFFIIIFGIIILSNIFIIKNWLINYPRIASIFSPILIIILSYNFLESIFQNTYIVIIILSVLSFGVSYYTINMLPNYLDVDINDMVTLFLSIFTILVEILPTKLPPFINATLIVIVVNLNGVNIYLNHRTKKCEEIAKKIMETQLMSKKVSYNELLKCYAVGGQKYKDKILENQRFLRLIRSKE